MNATTQHIKYLLPRSGLYVCLNFTNLLVNSTNNAPTNPLKELLKIISTNHITPRIANKIYSIGLYAVSVSKSVYSISPIIIIND